MNKKRNKISVLLSVFLLKIPLFENYFTGIQTEHKKVFKCSIFPFLAFFPVFYDFQITGECSL